MTERASYTSVIANRGFLNLWINQILVQLSYNSLNFALIIWVFQLTNSTTAVAALMFAVYLPSVFFGLFSGVLVDLMDRKKIIMVINICLAFLFFSLIFLKFYYPAIVVVAFLVNTLGQFYLPTEASAIPLMVKRRELITANSIFSATLYSCFLLGFGLAGPAISHLGINFVFGFGTTILILGFILAFAFPTIFAKPDQQGKKLLHALRYKKYSEIKEIGLEEILQTLRLIRGKLPVLTSITILAGVQVVIGVLAVLLPAFLERALQVQATDASYILVIPLGLGIVLGGLILGKIGSIIIRRRVVSYGILFGGLLFLFMAIAPIIFPAISYFQIHGPLPFFYQPPLSLLLIISSFFLGIAMVSILVPSQTVLQENTPDEDRGKVFATLGVAMSALSLIPVLLAGILADLYGVIPILMGVGITITLTGIFGLKPSLFFSKRTLPYNVREFLGLEHWER